MDIQPLATALNATAYRVPMPEGPDLSVYHCAAAEGMREPSAAPLLAVHSVNATAGAFEWLPFLRLQARHRDVVALDLPGFGESGKDDIAYTPALMQQAVTAVAVWMESAVSPKPIDGVALSLGCEFMAEVVLQRPERFRTLTLVSPTGMEGRRRNESYEGSRTRESRLARTVLRNTPIGSLLYRGLTTRAVMRFFLSRSWGTEDFDRRLLAYGRRDAAQQGARYAPLDFVAGALFTRGIVERYRALPLPVWVAHGTRGSFIDFAACPERTGTAQTKHRLTRTVFEAGAMPHFELPEAFTEAFDSFTHADSAVGTDARRTVAAPLPQLVPGLASR